MKRQLCFYVSIIIDRTPTEVLNGEHDNRLSVVEQKPTFEGRSEKEPIVPIVRNEN